MRCDRWRRLSIGVPTLVLLLTASSCSAAPRASGGNVDVKQLAKQYEAIVGPLGSRLSALKGESSLSTSSFEKQAAAVYRELVARVSALAWPASMRGDERAYLTAASKVATYLQSGLIAEAASEQATYVADADILRHDLGLPPGSVGKLSGTPSASASTSSSSSTTATIVPTTTRPSTSVTEVPLVACPTTYGVTQSSTPTLPPSEPIALPSALIGQVAIYSDGQGQVEVLAPYGWSCAAQVGADGSSSTMVYPPGEPLSAADLHTTSRDEAVVGSQTSACYGCTLGQACPLFPAAAKAYEATYGPCPSTPPPDQSVVQLSATAVAFSDPPGVKGEGVPSGGPYTANGVMTYVNLTNAAPSYLDTCTLPASQHALCTAALNLFVSSYGNQ